MTHLIVNARIDRSESYLATSAGHFFGEPPSPHLRRRREKNSNCREVDKIWDLVTDLPTTSYRFGRQPENHRFRFAKNKFPNLFIIDVEYGTDVEKETIPENSNYLISAINAGTARFELSGKEIDGRPGSVVASSAGMHQRILHEADTRKTVVVIPKQSLHAHLQRFSGLPIEEAPDFQIAAADPAFARRWMSFLAFVHETTKAGTLSSASETLIEEQFMGLLLEHHPHTYLESPNALPPFNLMWFAKLNASLNARRIDPYPLARSRPRRGAAFQPATGIRRISNNAAGLPRCQASRTCPPSSCNRGAGDDGDPDCDRTWLHASRTVRCGVQSQIWAVAARHASTRSIAAKEEYQTNNRPKPGVEVFRDALSALCRRECRSSGMPFAFGSAWHLHVPIRRR